MFVFYIRSNRCECGCLLRLCTFELQEMRDIKEDPMGVYLQEAGKGRKRLTKCILKTSKIQFIKYPPPHLLPFPRLSENHSCSAVKLRPTHQQLVDNNTAKTFSITFRRSTGTTCHLVLPLPIPFADFITRIALLDHPSSCRASVN